MGFFDDIFSSIQGGARLALELEEKHREEYEHRETLRQIEEQKLQSQIELENIRHQNHLEELKLKANLNNPHLKNFSENGINNMSGEEYEIFCQELIIDEGWEVSRTPKSNDQGVDLIATISDNKVCIQCKRYSNPVGNKAVQEIIAGTEFYGGSNSVVISNSGFTKSAKQLAKSCEVVLIHHDEISNLDNFI